MELINQTLMNLTSVKRKHGDIKTTVEFTADRILTIITISVLIPCIMAGNSLVIAAVIKTRQLRTVTNAFVTSLAVTDGIVGAVCLPVYMAFTIKGHFWFHFNHPGMQEVWKGLDTITGVTLIVHLMAISIDRYICIHYPFTYRKIMSARKSAVLIVFSWMYGVFNYSLTFIPTLTNKNRIMILTVLAYVLPLCVTTAAYLSIARVAGKQVRRIKGLQNENKSTITFFLKEVKAAAVLAVVLFAFILCWTGIFIMNLKFVICRYCSSCDCTEPTSEVVNATKMLQYSSSFVDPILYASLNKDFRKAIKKILCGRSRNNGLLLSRSSVNTRSVRFTTQDSASYEEIKLQDKIT